MNRGIKPQPGTRPAPAPVWQTMLLLTTGSILGATVCKLNEATAFCRTIGWWVAG